MWGHCDFWGWCLGSNNTGVLLHMNIGAISITDDVLHTLMDTTESLTPLEALDKAVRFTLLHKKDEIRNALYELAIGSIKK